MPCLSLVLYKNLHVQRVWEIRKISLFRGSRQILAQNTQKADGTQMCIHLRATVCVGDKLRVSWTFADFMVCCCLLMTYCFCSFLFLTKCTPLLGFLQFFYDLFSNAWGFVAAQWLVKYLLITSHLRKGGVQIYITSFVWKQKNIWDYP